MVRHKQKKKVVTKQREGSLKMGAATSSPKLTEAAKSVAQIDALHREVDKTLNSEEKCPVLGKTWSSIKKSHFRTCFLDMKMTPLKTNTYYIIRMLVFFTVTYHPTKKLSYHFPRIPFNELMHAFGSFNLGKEANVGKEDGGNIPSVSTFKENYRSFFKVLFQNLAHYLNMPDNWRNTSKYANLGYGIKRAIVYKHLDALVSQHKLGGGGDVEDLLSQAANITTEALCKMNVKRIEEKKPQCALQEETATVVPFLAVFHPYIKGDISGTLYRTTHLKTEQHYAKFLRAIETKTLDTYYAKTIKYIESLDNKVETLRAKPPADDGETSSQHPNKVNSTVRGKNVTAISTEPANEHNNPDRPDNKDLGSPSVPSGREDCVVTSSNISHQGQLSYTELEEEASLCVKNWYDSDIGATALTASTAFPVREELVRL